MDSPSASEKKNESKGETSGEDILSDAFSSVAENLVDLCVVQDFVGGEDGAPSRTKGDAGGGSGWLTPNFQEFHLNLLLRQAISDKIRYDSSSGPSRFLVEGERMVTRKGIQRYIDVYLEDSEKKECYVVELKYHSVTYVLENARKLREDERKNGAEWSDKQKPILKISPSSKEYWESGIVQKREILKENLAAWKRDFDAARYGDSSDLSRALSFYSVRVFGKGGGVKDNGVISLSEYIGNETPNDLRKSFLEQVSYQAELLAFEKGPEYKIFPMVVIGLYDRLFLIRTSPDKRPYEYLGKPSLLGSSIEKRDIRIRNKIRTIVTEVTKCARCERKCAKLELGTGYFFCNRKCQLEYREKEETYASPYSEDE